VCRLGEGAIVYSWPVRRSNCLCRSSTSFKFADDGDAYVRFHHHHHAANFNPFTPHNFFSIIFKEKLFFAIVEVGCRLKNKLNFRQKFNMKLSIAAVLAASSSVAAFQPASLRTTSPLRNVRVNAVALPVFEGVASSLKKEKKGLGGPTVDMTGIMLSVS
jgi:hypothetical protein